MHHLLLIKTIIFGGKAGSFELRTTCRDGAVVAVRKLSCFVLVKLGAKGCPRRGTVHSALRTSHRDDASYARFLVNLSKL